MVIASITLGFRTMSVSFRDVEERVVTISE